ncbi:uncharacterized protein RHO25_004074 [Cercospora beticola]|uniref:Autophagy-related protein n=1 Tax=Cercospora beticola TaxID=122368 RepID=A0ABZ0NIX5_CERBT|nr:hypothetical protein RHO25_004074 [Cercospora beticola]
MTLNNSLHSEISILLTLTAARTILQICGMLNWNAVSAFFCFFTVGVNAAIDTGFYAGPQWQNLAPLDCLYSTVERIVPQVLESWPRVPEPPASYNADRKEDQAPATSSLRFARDLAGRSVLLLNTAAAIATLAMFLSPENGIWVKACVANAVICWICGKFRFTRESEPAEPDLTASSAQQPPLADHENLTLHAQITVSLAFVFLANALLWCLAVGLSMDLRCWLYFATSNAILGTFAVLFCKRPMSPLGALGHIFLGVVESLFLLPAWLFEYSDMARAAAAKASKQEGALNGSQFLAILFLSFAIEICLWRKIHGRSNSYWAQLVPATSLLLLAGLVCVLVPSKFGTPSLQRMG